MAKRIVDEEMKFDVIINGDNAQKELYDLEKSTRKLTEENKQLELQKKKLIRQNKEESEEYKELTKHLRDNNKEIKANKTRMAELSKQIGITALTTGQLSKEASRLKLLLRNLVPGSADHQRYTADLKKISLRMDELNGKAKVTKLSLSSMADSFNKYQAMGASILLVFTGVVLSLQKMIDYNGKLAGAQSNVMKTTQMTRKEVDELTKSFGLFKSRTSRIDLLGIAEQGGRIGIAKDQIQQFVGVMDKASVALGDSFTGGPEEVAEKLGKIKFLFEETKGMNVEQAYMSIGSAINDLGANGVASERNIAEFTTRIGSLTDVLKPTVAETLALGAAFEESGIEAEVSSRAYNIFMKQASTEAGKFAQVMGLTKKEVEDLINKNPLEFMLKFAEGMKGMNATETAKTLDYLGINADGANKAIGAMGNNTARFRELLQLSNQSFEEGTSLIEEYNIKNNDLEATLAKIKKTVTGWFSSEGLVAFLAASAEWFGKFIGATEDADGSVQKWRNTLGFAAKVLAVLIASILSYNAGAKLAILFSNGMTSATNLFNIAAKAKVMWIALQRAALTIYTSVMGYFGIATDKATASLVRMNAVSKASPWGAVLAVIGAVVAAYLAFSASADEAAAASKRLTASQEVDLEQTRELSKSKADLQSKVEPLIKILKDENSSLETRKIAYQKLIDISPAFVDTVDAEFRATNKLTEAYAKLLVKLDQAALARARETVRQKRAQEVADAEMAEFEAKKKADAEAAANAAKRKANEKNAEEFIQRESTSTREYSSMHSNQQNYAFTDKQAYEEAKKRATDARKAMLDYTKYQETTLAQLEAELKKHKEGSAEAIRIQGEINALLGGGGVAGAEGGGSDYNVPGGSDGEKAAKAHEKRMDDLDKQIEELRELKRQAIDDGLDLMKDGFEKELALQKEAHNRKLEDLKRQLISEKDIMAADKIINDPDSSAQDVAFWTRQKEVWLEKNQHLNNLIRIEEQTHYSKLGTIIEKENARQIKAIDDRHKRLKVLNETSFLEELNAMESLAEAKAAIGDFISAEELGRITTLEEAKKVLKEKFQKEELEAELRHVEESIAKMEEQIASSTLNWKGIELSLLTPEQRAKMEAEIEFARLKAEELKDALSGKAPKKKDKWGKDADGGTDDVHDAFKGAFGDSDVLGYTADQWGETFKSLDHLSEKLNAAKMVIGAMQNAWAQYGAFVDANEAAKLKSFEKNSDSKKRKLKWQLDNGYINQVQYNRGVETVEAEVEKKRADAEYRQAKRQKQMAVVNILMSTAQAIMGIWAQFPKADFGVTAGIMSGVVGALGALQLATVLKTPLPAKGYEEGLYSDVVREQDGKVFRSRYGGTTKSGIVNRPTHFLTGENGPEMIIDAKAYRELSPGTRDALVRELRGIKGWEKGMYNNDVTNPRFEVPASGSSASGSGTVSQEYLLSVISQNTAILEKVYNDGLVAVMTKEPRQLKKLQDEMKRVTDSRKKAEQ